MKSIASVGVSLVALLLFTGCTLLNPETLTDPVETPQAAFKYNLHTVVTDADGNEKVDAGDAIVVDNTALKDNWSINLDRTYYDTTQMPIEGMRVVGDVLLQHAASGSAPTPEQLLLYAGIVQTVADYDIPLILQGEKADVQRANDPEAFAEARKAQFTAAADLAKHQTDAIKETAKLGIRAATPMGAASGAFDTLAERLVIKSSGSSNTPATEVTE